MDDFAGLTRLVDAFELGVLDSSSGTFARFSLTAHRGFDLLSLHMWLVFADQPFCGFGVVGAQPRRRFCLQHQVTD